MNFHVWHELSDPQDHLAWLENELISAEKLGEKVILIGHVPPNDLECLFAWSSRFKALQERFQHVIRGMYYGHNHEDDFAINSGYENQNPLGVILMTPSVTTEGGKNPSFRIMELDTETMLPIKMEKYFFNVTRANDLNEPIWSLMYNYQEEYDLKNLSPSSINNLAERIKEDEELAV